MLIGREKELKLLKEMNIEKTVKWHERMFPQATYKSQIKHLIQELKEVLEAQTVAEAVDEFADVVIVLVSLKRFNETKYLADEVLKSFDSYIQKLDKFIERKMIKIAYRVGQGAYFWNGEDYDRKRVDILK